MVKNLIVVQVEENPNLTPEEIAEVYDIPVDFIYTVIEYGAIEPHSISKKTMHFDETQLRRIKKIVNLHKDLEVNVPGAALIVDLLEEMEQMRAEIEILKKYFGE